MILDRARLSIYFWTKGNQIINAVGADNVGKHWFKILILVHVTSFKCEFLLAMRMKYTLSMLDGYVVSQFERLQSGYEGMADYVAAINVVARSAVKQAYSSGFTIDKQDPVSIKLHFNLLANLPYSFPNV